MIWGQKEFDYVIRKYFDPKFLRQWPGVELVRDDGQTVHQEEPGRRGFYVYVTVIVRELMARDPKIEAVRRLRLKVPSIALSDRQMFWQIVDDLEEQLEKFWQDTHPDWPGLGPAGRSR